MNPIQAPFTFSPRILDHLGISAYNSVKKCLSELVANSYDADATRVEITLPDGAVGEAIIRLTDDGGGMSPSDLTEKFLHIGRDRREDGDRTASGRLIIGSKGIGKLAGFGIASRMRVTTRRNGEQSVLSIDKSDLESIEQLATHKFNIIVTDTELSNGTTIELVGMDSSLQIPSDEAIRKHLHRTMPSRPGFTMFVDGQECTSEEVSGTRYDISQEIPGVGIVTGFYIVANTRQPNPGLAVRVRGRIVQEPSLFGLDTKAHGFFTSEKIVGEFHAEFLDPEGLGSKRQNLLKTTRDGLVDDAEIVKSFEAWASDFVKEIIQGIDSTEIEKRSTSLINSQEIKGRLEKLSPHIRGTAVSIVRGVLAKLKTASDEDATNLIEWIIKYYESNMLKELMDAIISADPQDAENLARLVSEWGVSQLGSIAKIVETQINIISRLEELIISNKSYEIDLHLLVEKNLWLVRESLELWASDKPLKTVLDGIIDAEYKGKEHLRPDIVCRSRDNGNEAAILEFKRPKEKITMAHVTQALEYEGIIRKHRPNLQFVIYIIGREYDSSVLAIKEKQAKAGLHLWSFEEILQKSRSRFEEILVILGK